ncbi:hypothetical protein [Maritimibacter sp. DP1N21-5]|uniref:hypothetical protein n=1 Tax=Maritimibacter sp. DP1N21-5 TaxID=2836867 RepID=UPI001C48BEF8|nr:hypothetical protein [Maritimibacter sp. DP1N21-5]MBV7410123.1 hypothetical protein [Maritimibacter sp. DP1N21-5]
MTAHVDPMTIQMPPSRGRPNPVKAAPSLIERTDWGYAFGIDRPAGASLGIGPIAARFGGAILFLAGIGLWLMPDAVHTADVYGMKMMAMVLFTLVGGVLVWQGRKRPGMEVQVDTESRVLRLGGRNLTNDFKIHDILSFDEVRSIFLMRANGRVPARLYLRLADGATGIEVARGRQNDMELLRETLFADLACRRPLT